MFLRQWSVDAPKAVYQQNWGAVGMGFARPHVVNGMVLPLPVGLLLRGDRSLHGSTTLICKDCEEVWIYVNEAVVSCANTAGDHHDFSVS